MQDLTPTRLLSGGFERPLIAAKRGDPASYRATYATALKRELDALPYDSVDAALKARRAAWDGYTPAALTGFIEQNLDPASTGGSIPHSTATSVISLRHTLRDIGPLPTNWSRDAVNAAHAAPKPTSGRRARSRWAPMTD
jgi:hypothetical protein